MPNHLRAPLVSRLRTLPLLDAQTGQILVMAAFFMTAMMGVLGLAVDVGFAVSQRRSMQNAADAGALAGTRIVAKSMPTAILYAQTDVENVVRANGMSGGVIGTITCTYVNDAGSSLGGCGSSVPVTATGVKVVVEEEHPTFFIQALPGAPNTVKTGADATAHVKKLGVPRDGPFIPCGTSTRLASGGQLNLLLQSGGAWIINPAAIDQTFQIHGPQIEKCNAKSSRFKGLAEGDSNADRTAPDWFEYKEGDSAGQIDNTVEGPNGCKAGQVIDNCVVFLPIAVPSPAEDASHVKQVYVVFFAPFYVTAPKSNEHNGKLLSDYVISGRGQAGDWGWTRDYGGPITIRLTE